jgi:hypothetical protein
MSAFKSLFQNYQYLLLIARKYMRYKCIFRNGELDIIWKGTKICIFTHFYI